MIDPDTLKQAVELAPGWELSNNDTWIENYKWSSVSCSTALVPDYVLDYLAAELVRLVDALPYDRRRKWDEFLIFPDSSGFYRWDYDGPESVYAPIDGKDRTANTINAIVQFARENPGVLSD